MKRYLLVISIILFLCCFVRATKARAQSITASSVTGSISACAGTASVSPNILEFTVSGSGLTGDITVTAPNNFEVSLSAGSGFANSVSLPESGGTVYVRSAAPDLPGNISGNVTLISGSVSIKVPVTGFINTLPTVDAVANQVVNNGVSTTSVHFTGTGNFYKWVNNTPGIGLPASGLGDIASFDALNSGTTPLVATITATPFFDGFAYVGDDGSGAVSVINTLTDKIVTTIPVGSGPNNVSVSADGSRVYVAASGSQIVSVINTATSAVIATIPVGATPYGIVVSPDGGMVYVANLSAPYVSVINTASNTLVTNIPMAAVSVDIAISPDGKFVYVSNDGSPGAVAVISTATNTVISTVAVDSQPYGLAVTPDGSMVYAANYSGDDVSVINTATNNVVATIAVGLSPTGVTVSPDGKLVYVAVENTNSVAVISTATNTVVSTIAVGVQPFGISITADGSKLYVANSTSHNVSVVNTATNTVITTIPVGMGPLGLQSVGNFITGGGCSGVPVTFTITVNPTPPPAITATGAPAPLNTIYGTASTSTVFTVSGTTITSGISITPPQGFEVSSNGVTYSNIVTIGAPAATGYNISPANVYIRLKSTTPAGNYTGNIVLSSTGAANVNVEMPVSTVTPAPLTVTAEDKSKNYEEINPVLTVTYSGFVNNDGPAQLTTQPAITTTAVTSSPVGQYPITVNGAESPNYTFTYISGVLTVNLPQMITVPNAFTPNGDGVNDTWDIKFIDSYPNCKVDVYNRWGENVYSSIGYGIPWEGTYKGAVLPSGTYYYVINLKNGFKVLSGFVAIIR